MRPRIAISGDIAAGLQADLEAGAAAVSGAIAIAARGLEQDLEHVTEGAGLGPLSRAWTSQVYPRGRASLGAAGLVYVKGKARTIGAIEAHATGAIIRAAGGRFLAIPTDAVPRRRGGRGGADWMSPAEVETAFNADLHLIKTKTGKLLLVMKAIAAKNRRGFRAATRRRVAQGRETTLVPMFVLIPQARLRKRFDINASVQRWVAQIPGLIVQEWDRRERNAT